MLTISLPDLALGSGFYLPGRGVHPLGRAGAYFASGEQDLNSLWYNPANLAGFEELQLTVDVAFINLSFDFQRAPRTLENGDVRTYEEVSNEAPAKLDPQILIGGPFFVEDMSWAFGLYAPYLSGHTFPEDGPQRYTLVDNDQSIAGFVHFALAYEFGENFRLGAGVQMVPASFSLINVTSGYTGLYGDPEDKDLDILSEIKLTSIFNFSGNIGIWFRLAENVHTAISFQAPVVFADDDAELTARLPSSPAFNNAELEGNTLAGNIKFPAVIRAAIRYKADDWDLELAGVYEGWSIFDEIQATPNEIAVTGVPGIGSIPVGPLSIPQEWQDTFSIRLGGDYDFNESFTLRSGYAFETGAIPDDRYSVFLADGNKHLLSLGATYEFGAWSLDAGLGYYLIPSKTVTNSQVRQINPTDTEDELTLIVGNGTYSQSYFAAGIGTNFRF